MASSAERPDPPIKEEPSYSSGTGSSHPLKTPESPSLKRRRSDETQDMGEKRQRVDSGSSANRPAGDLPGDDFNTMLAQVGGAVMQQYAPSGIELAYSPPQVGQSCPLATQNEHTEPQSQNNGFVSDPHLYMRILSLPILESLSTQILSTLIQGNWLATVKVVQSPDSELGQAFTTLKSLFDQTKRIYSQKTPFLSADALNIQDLEHRAIIRNTNLATFVSAVFGGGHVGFYELNDHFIETFTRDGEPMSKEAGDLFLSLKTQMFVSAVTQEEQERTKEDILEDFFPVGLDELLLGRHPGMELAESEDEFLRESQARRDYLMKEVTDLESIQEISSKFAWEEFLQSLSSYLSKTYGPLITPYMKRHALTAPASPIREASRNAIQSPEDLDFAFENVLEQAKQAAIDDALKRLPGKDHSQNHNGSSPPQQSEGDMNQDKSGENKAIVIPPHPSQSKPTQVLYEEARMAAVSKQNTSSTRRPGLPSQRRPWTNDEECALMTGLDMVKGPHWSQILALFGPNGSHGEPLKDRNQVQLKDKARNLKLFFLKNGAEVPYYLQAVTGELKTRAPSQAARKEAEARQKFNRSEEKSRVNGIMTLAQGLQDHNHDNSAQASRSPSREESPFHVIEPANQDNSQSSLTALQPEDEHLRQSLMAASDTLVGIRSAPTASMI